MEARAFERAAARAQGTTVSGGMLEPAPGGLAERVAGRLGNPHPATAFIVALLGGLVLAAGASILLGLLVVEVLLRSGGVAAADQSFVESVVAERTAILTDLADTGGIVGSFALSGVAALVAIAAAFKRRWALAAFAAFVPLTESALYRITATVVPRERPDVVRLEALPADASYPSGHVGASVAVYVGLMLVLGSRIERGSALAALWVVALTLPAFVAFSRMYAGMHHPLDAAAGALVGSAAIAVVVFACRTASAAAVRRSMY